MTISKVRRWEIFEETGWHCTYCGIPIQQLGSRHRTNDIMLTVAVIDHADPDGGDEDDNLNPVCFSCNTAKGRRTLKQWFLDIDGGRAAPPSLARQGRMWGGLNEEWDADLGLVRKVKCGHHHPNRYSRRLYCVECSA